ncbi:asparagine--tRNA ligase, partial [Colwellia sp. D2M02]|uniref:OB-fold nucleic acid binding domain-containing protein n=1 Tax=Colwellia sp. D2M02 TaxID=2841562 RepID=UPI00209069FD
MAQAPVADIFAGKYSVGQQVTVKGWVRTRRDSKAGLSFIALHDGSCFDPIQVIALNTLNNYTDIQRLTTSCSIIATAVLKASQGQGQSLEIKASQVEVVGWVENPDTYPMAPKRHSLEYLREHAHLRPRTNVIGAVTRVSNC